MLETKSLAPEMRNTDILMYGFCSSTYTELSRFGQQIESLMNYFNEVLH